MLGYNHGPIDQNQATMVEAGLIRQFGISAAVTVVALAAALATQGLAALLVTALLIVIEVAFSFDNAIVNAKMLGRLSKVWQQAFLTIGIVIAIFGMRLAFPVLIVALSAHLQWQEVVRLALHDPKTYAEHLERAHPFISAFGGSFLLMLSLQFFVDERRRVRWLASVERQLQRLNRHYAPALLTAGLLLLVAWVPANHHVPATLQAGIAGVVVYALLQALVAGFERLQAKESAAKNRGLTGWAAFATFVYLEILDASFSFDGVIGAFAVTASVLLIMLGLGVGAIWVRSMTVYMVRKGTLDTYRYLEHGAHYTIAALAVSLLASLFVEVPQLLIGLAGLGFIGGSFIASRRANQQCR